MAGHSQFKNIMHRKNAQDAKKTKIFTKIIKEISVAVKTGGPDPESNPRLRLVLQNARGANMSKDVYERAIKKAAGVGGEDYVEGTFECYGPEGVALFVEVATDNNTRTVSNVRSYLNKYGGSLGKDGCLQFVFEQKGIFFISAEGLNEDDFTMDMIDAGAEDVVFEEGKVTIICDKVEFGQIQKKIAELKIEAQEAGLQRLPLNMKSLSEDAKIKFNKLLDALEEDDDVLKVYHNAEL